MIWWLECHIHEIKGVNKYAHSNLIMVICVCVFILAIIGIQNLSDQNIYTDVVVLNNSK